MFAAFATRAAYVPVAVAGYNADVVANGTGPAASSTVLDVDGVSYVFMAPDYVNPAGLAPATFLPADGMVYSQLTSGVKYQLAPYTGLNTLRLLTGTSGTLTFPSPQNLSASEIFVLATSGSAAGSFTATVTFTDATTQVFTGNTVGDWYNAANYAVRGLGRVNKTNDNIENDWNNPRLYEVKLTLAATNFSKQIASVTIAHTAAGGVLNVMGIAVNTVPACAAPTAQSTALSITPGSTTTTVAFSAAVPAADKYLVVRTSGAPLSINPTNGVAYPVNLPLGNGIVVSNSNATSVVDAGLTPGTLYRYTVFAYNDLCTGGPLYNTTNFPSTTASTTSAATGGLNSIAATGWNSDIVANGTGPAIASVNDSLDGAGHAFMASNYNPAGTTPTQFMPVSGTVSPAGVPGLSFVLQPYGGNNALRVPSYATPTLLSGTLTATTPFSASQLYLLETSGDGTAMATVTVTFTDNSTQVFTGQTFADWFGGLTNVAITGLGRVKVVTNFIDNNTSNPRLYYLPITISTSNYSKLVSTVTVTRTSAGGNIAVMGLAANVLPTCIAPTAQATGLSLVPGSTQVSGGFTTAAGSPNKYLVVRTPGAAALSANPVNGTAYTAGGTLGNGTIVNAAAANTFTDAGLTGATGYTYTVFAYNDVCNGGPLYLTTNPLTAATTTLGAGGATYTWTGATNFTYTVASNWSPARVTPDPADILLFNNGAKNAVWGVVSQTVRRIVVSNNTAVIMQPFNSTTAVTLTLASDGVNTTDELSVAAGSTLMLTSGTSTGSQTVAFGGTGATASVAGTLEAYSIAVAGINYFNLANAVTTVTATGTIGAGGNISTTSSFQNASATSLIINGTLKHNYHLPTLPAIPTATYAAGSTVLMRGVTTATTAPGGLGQTFSNFTYECRSQGTNTNTAVIQNWAGTGPLNVTGTFSMVSSGIGTLAFTATTPYNYNVNNYTQTGGILNLATGAPSGPAALNVSGTFNQIFSTSFGGGGITSTGTGSGANSPTIHFNGTSGVQNVTFIGSGAGGPVTYRVSNPAGINLANTGPLTMLFNVNTNGGIRISTTAASPINTSLLLNYAAGSTLTYDAPGQTAITGTVFHDGVMSAPPPNLTINTGSSGNVVTMPFSRTLSGTLTMTSGDVALGAATLTLGTSAAAPGILAYTAGFLRTTPGGQFVRWYGTAGLPTAAGTGIGFYPMGHNGLSRAVALSGSTAAAITTGGTIGVQHTHVGGLATIPAVNDAGYSIDTRTNAAWNFVASGVTLGGTLNMSLTGAGLFSANNPANLRVMKLASVAGTHVPGAGVTANRSGLSLADLTSAHYIGANAVDIGGAYIAINTGAWNTASTWDINLVPGSANDAYVNPGVIVTATGTNNAAKALNILPGGSLNIAATASVTLDSTLQNSGTVNLTGGTLAVRGGTAVGILNTGTIAMSSGDLTLGTLNSTPNNRAFAQNGTLTVSGGALTVFGAFSTIAASINNQSGGSISVDGNQGGVPAASVAQGTPIVRLLNAANSFTGGTFTIVDAHAGTGGTNTFEYNNTTSISATGTHVFRIGDGISTDPGGQTPYNFSVNTAIGTGRFAFNDLVVNSGTAVNSYFVQGASPMGVSRDLIVNSGGEFRNGTGQTTWIGRDLTVNTGGTFTGLGTAGFGNYSTGAVQVATNTQEVSGGGTFRNQVSAAPTARFQSITINNNSAGGVRFGIGDTKYAGTLLFTLGRLFMTGGSIMQQNAGAGVTGPGQTTGWVVGKFQKAQATAVGFTHDYFIGDSLYYSPLNISGTAATPGDIVVGVTVPDHPQVGTSGINPGRSVNRWWSIQQVNGLTMSATVATTVRPTWNLADLDPGATAPFITARYVAPTWTLPAITAQTATTITGSQIASVINGEYAVGEACSPVVIGTQPMAQTVCEGSPATFSVTLTSGGGSNFQWLRNGTPIPGATTNPYTIPAAALTDAGSYSVTITSGCAGSTAVTSTAVALTVQAAPAVSAQPISQIKCEGESVTFSVTATNIVAYQWRKNGVAIAGVTGASFTIPGIVSADAGSYSVVLTGTTPCGTFLSQSATLTINPLPVAITAVSTTTFCTGGSVVLNAATGFNYQWLLNNAPITGATASSFTATATGSYSAIVSSASGCTDTSNAIVVTVGTPPSANITPAGSAAFCAGGTVTLNGPSAGGLAYQWNLNGNPIGGATSASYAAGAVGSYTVTVSLTTNASCSSTTTTPTMVTQNPLPTATATAAGATSVCQGQTVMLNGNTGTGLNYQWNLNGTPIAIGGTASSFIASASGAYTVTVTNTATTCNQTSAAVTVTINTPPSATVTTSGATTFCQGGGVTLSAPTGANLSYIWYRDAQVIIPAATGSSYVANVGGSYTVVITNTVTNCTQTSTPTAVTVNPAGNATVTASGAMSLCQGQTVTLSVPVATGQTYQWRLNNTNITGATTTTYTTGAAGSYTVVVTAPGTACPATSTVQVVTVNSLPPATATAIGGTTVCSGALVNLSANGGTGLAYQWQLGGVPIPGATVAAYPAVATGAYTVTVTSAAGCSNTSSAVGVTVNPTPAVSVASATPITFCEGSAVVLNASANVPVSTYQWRQNGVVIPGANQPFYQAILGGNYTVTVATTAPCSATSAPLLVTVHPAPQPPIILTNGVLSTGFYASYQWYRNGQPVAGANSQTYTPTQTGAFYVQVLDANGCTATSDSKFVSSLGVDDKANGDAVRVYPNPANDFLHIAAPVRVDATLREATGKRVLRVDDAKTIDLRGLADGNYILTLTDAGGRVILHQRVVKRGE